MESASVPLLSARGLSHFSYTEVRREDELREFGQQLAGSLGFVAPDLLLEDPGDATDQRFLDRLRKVAPVKGAVAQEIDEVAHPGVVEAGGAAGGRDRLDHAHPGRCRMSSDVLEQCLEAGDDLILRGLGSFAG